MQAALDHLRAQPGVDAVFLSFEPDNTGADRLYTSLGFRRTGRVEYGEIVVKLEF
jgi:diamine N-acetyltransferase